MMTPKSCTALWPGRGRLWEGTTNENVCQTPLLPLRLIPRLIRENQISYHLKSNFLSLSGQAVARGLGVPTGPTWQQQMLAKGWGYATLNTGSVQADNGAGLTSGIIGLVNKAGSRGGLEDWGVLAAWSCAGSTTDAWIILRRTPAVDAKRGGGWKGTRAGGRRRFWPWPWISSLRLPM